jgi:hypothetical protein
MARRSTSQRAIDKRCFPIRVRFALPSDRMGYPDGAKMTEWLRQSLPQGDFAEHPDSGSSFHEAFAVYFRRVPDAQRFIDAFPVPNWPMAPDRQATPAQPCKQVAALSNPFRPLFAN